MSKLKEGELLDEFEKCFGHHPSSIRNEQAYQQIKEMIQKYPTKEFTVTKEFIEEKARELHKQVYGSSVKCDYQCNMMIEFRKQIRALFKVAR